LNPKRHYLLQWQKKKGQNLKQLSSLNQKRLYELVK
jgi:hypothetical protein